MKKQDPHLQEKPGRLLSEQSREHLEAQVEELRRAQLELSRSHDFYVELFDLAPVGYLILDGGRTIREANSTAAVLFGLQRKDLLGLHLSTFMGKADADSYHRFLRAVRDTESPHSGEMLFRRSDGSFFHGRLDILPHEDNRTGKGWRIALGDVSVQKQVEDKLLGAQEELEGLLQERTRLAMDLEISRNALRRLASELVMAEERERKRIAGVLHDDIAQVLASVRMRLDMLKGNPSAGEAAGRLEEAKALLVRTLRDTRSLMMDIGNPLLFEMGLQAACESLADRLMESHPVRIVCDVRVGLGEVDPDVNAILYRLTQELLNNIVKHSRASRARVRIVRENNRIRAEVSDNGTGFDPRMIGLPTAEGGFGLFSIRERLLSMQGELRIDSTPGVGTTVTAVLPSKTATGSPTRPTGLTTEKKGNQT
jgi:PAS domain S-box-containing protein